MSLHVHMDVHTHTHTHIHTMHTALPPQKLSIADLSGELLFILQNPDGFSTTVQSLLLPSSSELLSMGAGYSYGIQLRRPLACLSLSGSFWG